MALVPTTMTTASGIFKKVYASITDILPEGYAFQEMANFDSAHKAGESYNYAIQLTHENGLTLAGSSGGVATFNDAQSGQVKQATLSGCETFITSALSTAVISRSAKEGEQAFKQATKNRVKANIKSHQKFIEHFCLYGQDTFGLGRVAYFTATWNLVDFTNGTGTLAGVAFTNGVNVAAKKFLINPADLASGIWIGSEGMEVRQRVIGSTLNNAGAIVAVDLKNGIVEVDFVPVAATAASSHCLELLNQDGASGKDFLGAKGILNTDGTVLGISNNTYGIWKGSRKVIAGTKLTFGLLMDSITEACNKGLDKDVCALTSFESWQDMMTEQAALRKYDTSYKPSDAEQGTEGIVFHSINGAVTVKPSRFVRRSDTFILAKEDWKRVGSSDISLNVPGADGDLLLKPVTTTAYLYRSYSDQALICMNPSSSVYISGIDPASTT